MTGRTRWEYAQLHLHRDPGGSWPITTTFFGPPDGTAEVMDGEANAVAVLCALGREGWEVVGPPEVERTIGTVPDLDDVTREHAYWVDRRFWLRRPID